MDCVSIYRRCRRRRRRGPSSVCVHNVRVSNSRDSSLSQSVFPSFSRQNRLAFGIARVGRVYFFIPGASGELARRFYYYFFFTRNCSPFSTHTHCDFYRGPLYSVITRLSSQLFLFTPFDFSSASIYLYTCIRHASLKSGCESENSMFFFYLLFVHVIDVKWPSSGV